MSDMWHAYQAAKFGSKLNRLKDVAWAISMNLTDKELVGLVAKELGAFEDQAYKLSLKVSALEWQMNELKNSIQSQQGAIQPPERALENGDPVQWEESYRVIHGLFVGPDPFDCRYSIVSTPGCQSGLFKIANDRLVGGLA